MRRSLAIGALVATVGGVIAWWLISGADSFETKAGGAGNSTIREAPSESSAAPASGIESTPEARGESLEQSEQLAASENQRDANARPTADATAPPEPRESNPAEVTPGESPRDAEAGTGPEGKTRLPAQWRCIGVLPESRRDYEVFADSSTAWSGSFSARMESRVADPEIPGAGCYQIIAADEFKGRRVEFALYMRTLNAAPGAHLVFRSFGEGREVDIDETESRWVRGTSGWARHSIVIDVPYNASIIGVGGRLVKTGTLWIDEASLQIVDGNTPLTQTPRPPGRSVWNPDPTKHPNALRNSGFEDTVDVPPSP